MLYTGQGVEQPTRDSPVGFTTKQPYPRVILPISEADKLPSKSGRRSFFYSSTLDSQPTRVQPRAKSTKANFELEISITPIYIPTESLMEFR